MKSLTNYSEEINKNKENPTVLSNILLDLGSRFALLTDKYILLELERAKYWDKNEYDSNDKRVSDEKLKMKWILTKEGEAWYVIKKDLVACETLRRVINKALDSLQTEAYNQY